MKTIDLGKSGEIGPAIDLSIVDSLDHPRLFVVVEDDEVVELSLKSPQSPEIVDRIAASALGIQPRRLTMIDGTMYVSGKGGIVRLSDRKKIFSSDEDVSRVARCELGLIACIGRRVFRVEDERYIGSASEVQMIAASSSAPPLAFARQGDAGVLVGLMNSDVREVDAQNATISVPGQLQSMRAAGDRLWIVTDQTISGYRIGERTLTDPIHVDVVGARDVGQVNENYLVVAGTFGRAMYRIATDSKGSGEKFVQVQREPSRLSQAVTDGRHILAGSREGLWMYLINARAELTTRQFEFAPPPSLTSASVASAQARISEDRRTLTMTWNVGGGQASQTWDYSDPQGAQFQCVVPIDGDFWVGHGRGLTVLKPIPPVPQTKNGRNQEIDRVAGNIRIDGPVRYIFPLLVGGGASFVSEFGGFGVAQFVEEPIAK